MVTLHWFGAIVDGVRRVIPPVSKFCLLFKLIFLHSFMSDLHDLHCLSVSIICGTFYHDEDAGTKVS